MRAALGWFRRHGFPLRVTADPDRSGPVYLARTKPRCHVQIDDRCIPFAGTFPTLDDLAAFRPWNRPEPT